MTPKRLIAPARLASTAVLRGQSDERLIDLTRAGNARAFEAIVHRYRRPLLKYCARILPPERAEDAVQQTFLSAYNSIANGDRELKLKPWLYRIAHNSALNLLRQNGWNHEQLDESFDGVLRPDQAVEARERLASVVASVKALPERQRDAIVLRELEGRSYEEIAASLGVTDGAVRQLLNRARTTLRAGATALTPYGLAERIADICTGAGGGASLAKVGAAVLVAGAVATGGVDHGVPGVGGSSGHQAGSAAAAAPPRGHAAPRRDDLLPVAKAPAATRQGARRRLPGEVERRAESHRHRGERSGGGDTSGHSGSQLVDDHSGSRSGRDSSGGDDGHSGSGSSGSGSSGSGDAMTTSSADGSSGSSGPEPSDSSGPGGAGETTTTTTSTSGSDDHSGELSSGGGTSGGSH
jgi:RNA polymerase sigma factor (sigma-70 family)